MAPRVHLKCTISQETRVAGSSFAWELKCRTVTSDVMAYGAVTMPRDNNTPHGIPRKKETLIWEHAKTVKQFKHWVNSEDAQQGRFWWWIRENSHGAPNWFGDRQICSQFGNINEMSWFWICSQSFWARTHCEINKRLCISVISSIWRKQMMDHLKYSARTEISKTKSLSSPPT